MIKEKVINNLQLLGVGVAMYPFTLPLHYFINCPIIANKEDSCQS